MKARKIKKGDTVKVLTGKDKGRTGKILKYSAVNRVLVEGVNLMKKHVKPDTNKGVQGGILERESSLNISNVQLLDSTNKATRVGFKFLKDGRKVRYSKSNGEMIDV